MKRIYGMRRTVFAALEGVADASAARAEKPAQAMGKGYDG